MYHFSPHARHDQHLFTSWEEARELWCRILDLGPLHALVLMPDHVHILSATWDQARWSAVASGFTRWRNTRDGVEGRSLWRPASHPVTVKDKQHLDRTRRYILLNPCRAGLVDDPLGWPFSTHRDSVGLAVPAALPRDKDPHGFHRYVSSDPSVASEGTGLPSRTTARQHHSLSQVSAAVSSLTRMPEHLLLKKHFSRHLLIASARRLTRLGSRPLAEALGIGRSTVRRSYADEAHVRLVAEVISDPRFKLLDGRSLVGCWRSYDEKKRGKRLST